MSQSQSLAVEAVLFLASFNLDDETDQFDLVEGIGNMADATARLCGAKDFRHLQEKPNVLLTAQFLNVTRTEYDDALIDSSGPEPGWFAILHLLGLALANSLPNDKTINMAAKMAAEIYALFYEAIEDEQNAQN